MVSMWDMAKFFKQFQDSFPSPTVLNMALGALRQIDWKQLSQQWPYVERAIADLKWSITLINSLEKVGIQVASARRIEKLNAALSMEAWFVPPSLPEKMLTELEKVVTSRDGANEAIALLLDWCTPTQAHRMIESACELDVFRTRKRLLMKALNAFSYGNYILAIPVFLAQADGVFKATLGKRLGPRNGLFKREEWELKDWSHFTKNQPVEELATAYLLSGFSIAMYEQFVWPVFTKEDFAKLRARFRRHPLSRHAVLHGIDTEYDTQENAVRSVFILDVVRILAAKVEKEFPSHNHTPSD